VFNNYAHKQSECILRLNWALTGDQFRPLRSNWSFDLPDETPMIRTAGVREICNLAVIEKCETSVSRARRGGEARPLTICGK
jgi:hypothetical protein